MRITELLRKLGGRLGIVRVVTLEEEGRRSAPRKVTTRTIGLKDLESEIRRDEVRALAELPAELSVTFDRVFEAAGIKPPPYGWTVERLHTLLSTDEYKTMDRTAVQKAVLGLLASEKVPVEDMVKDAVSRDHAIDAYEAFVHRKMKDRDAARRTRIAEVRSQIMGLEQECIKQAEESKIDAERWKEWLARKIACEKDMEWALGYLVDRPVITVTDPESDK